MADDQGQITPEAASTEQPSPMPSENQNVPEATEAEPASPQGDSSSNQDSPELPEGVKERTTEQFEKLKRQLAEERRQRLQIEQMFNPRPQQAQPQQPSVPDYFDPETGQINVDKLEARNRQLESQLSNLQGTVQSIRDSEQTKQEEEAFAAYPELNPNTEKTFDETFHRAVTGYLTDAYLRGEKPSFKQAADAISSFRSKSISKAEAQGAQKAIDQLTPKEQASLEAEGRSDRRVLVGAQQETLISRTREGDMGAVAERLKNLASVTK